MREILNKYTKDRRMIAGGVLILLFILLAIAVFMKNDEKPDSPEKTAKISITASGFVPASLLVEKGTKIVWTNTDSSNHQIASNSHPEHKDLPGLKSEVLNNNQTYEYVADKPGSYGYHDETNPAVNGNIEVKE